MRSDPGEYEMIAPENLQAVISLMASEPGSWLPIAGGTDVMVQFAAGKLPARKLVNIWNLLELRRIEIASAEIRIGAGSTYTDLRRHKIIESEFPLLVSAARWTGGIANQNRGTIGGNIVNASPAADSLPALLVYDAELILVSARGERRVTYSNFHTGYRKTRLAPDELVRAVCLARRSPGYFDYARKVGARNAQAIAKVCIAATGRMAGRAVDDVRIAVGSVAPVPLRLTGTERAVQGRVVDADLLRLAKKSVAAEIQPIDDIRSTARYRSAVAGNLVVEFLKRLSAKIGGEEFGAANTVLAEWNTLASDEAMSAILPCCGSHAWARGMAARRPIADEAALMAVANEVWGKLAESDWMEAFRSHPRIGGSGTEQSSTAQSAEWSAQEQRNVEDAEAAVKSALREANREYERRFKRIFIICATGKSAAQMLEILRRRLNNDANTELHEAAEQQRQIMELRLRKWLER